MAHATVPGAYAALAAAQSPAQGGSSATPGAEVVARALTPAYFSVPVVAEMVGDTVRVQFKEAKVDFTEVVRNRLLFVVRDSMVIGTK